MIMKRFSVVTTVNDKIGIKSLSIVNMMLWLALPSSLIYVSKYSFACVKTIKLYL